MSTNGTHALTVVGLYAENVKRLRVVSIVPPTTGLVPIAGRNDQGKSSTLDSVMMALAGKNAQPDVPIHDGANHAKVVLDLGELRVTRTWTGNSTSYLTVQRRGDKGPLRAPQDVLDHMIGSGLGFDPLEFVSEKPAKQTATLLSLLKLPEDPRQLDAEKKRLYDERTLVNREVKQLDAKLGGMAEAAEDVPDVEVSVAELAQEHARLVALHHENDEKHAAVTRAAETLAEKRTRLAALRQQIEVAEREQADAEDALARAEAETLGLTDPDLTAITTQMQNAEAINATVRQKRARAETATALLAKQREAADLTDSMTALDDKKRALLAAAPFPIPGLGFESIDGDYVVTFDGIPLTQCSDSKKIRVGMAIAMALNPNVRVILLRNGSLLDEDNRRAIEEMATAGGFQVWMEIVGQGDEASFVIEDGGIIRAPNVAKAAISPIAGAEW